MAQISSDMLGGHPDVDEVNKSIFNEVNRRKKYYKSYPNPA